MPAKNIFPDALKKKTYLNPDADVPEPPEAADESPPPSSSQRQAGVLTFPTQSTPCRSYEY